MAGSWNPSLHPRDRQGRWKKKGGSSGGSRRRLKTNSRGDGPGVSRKAGPGTVTLRASLRSATVQYGRTLPLIPGKINVYGGVLFRVEKAGDRATFLEKKRDQAVEKIASRIPSSRAGDAVKDILRTGKTNVGGVTVGRNSSRRRASSIRVSNKKTAGRRVRTPRQPRQRRS